MERAMTASLKAVELRPELPEVLVARAWILYAGGQYEDSARCARQALERKRDCEGAYYILGRALFSAGKYQDLAAVADTALEGSGSDYNAYVPIMNALGALGKTEALRNVRMRRVGALEAHLREVPEDARARVLLAGDYANLGRADDAVREARLAIVLRPNEATVLYNAACVFCTLGKKADSIDALRKAWSAGFKDPQWARRDPELVPLHGDPEFDRLYPATEASA
jgi:tetratricopeptide (TPR) repeat protein